MFFVMALTFFRMIMIYIYIYHSATVKDALDGDHPHPLSSIVSLLQYFTVLKLKLKFSKRKNPNLIKYIIFYDIIRTYRTVL